MANLKDVQAVATAVATKVVAVVRSILRGSKSDDPGITFRPKLSKGSYSTSAGVWADFNAVGECKGIKVAHLDTDGFAVVDDNAIEVAGVSDDGVFYTVTVYIPKVHTLKR